MTTSVTERRPHPLKVLVIDDVPDLADLASALLSAHGIATGVACSGAAGLRVLQQDTDINAIFSDIMMPGMTGLELAMIVRQRYPGVNIVLTSGFIPLEVLAQHERLFLFTPKPYRIETVIDLLRRDPQPESLHLVR